MARLVGGGHVQPVNTNSVLKCGLTPMCAALTCPSRCSGNGVNAGGTDESIMTGLDLKVDCAPYMCNVRGVCFGSLGHAWDLITFLSLLGTACVSGVVHCDVRGFATTRHSSIHLQQSWSCDERTSDVRVGMTLSIQRIHYLNPQINKSVFESSIRFPTFVANHWKRRKPNNHTDGSCYSLSPSGSRVGSKRV